VSEDIVRLSVPIDKSINDKLAILIPQGMKASVVRELLDLLIKTQVENPEQCLMENLLRGNCKLVVQNLNKVDTND